MKYFIGGSTARTAADLSGSHRNTAARFFHKLREKIALRQQGRSEPFSGENELDESYFGGIRKGKRGRQNSCFLHFEAWWEGLHTGCPGCQGKNLDAGHTA